MIPPMLFRNVYYFSLFTILTSNWTFAVTDMKVPLAQIQGREAFSRNYDSLRVGDFNQVDYTEISERKIIMTLEAEGDRPITPTEFDTRAFFGTGFSRLEEGFYRGHPVFVKFPNRNGFNLRQIKLYKYLSDAGLGPHFFGLTSDESADFSASEVEKGKIGIALEYLPGIHTNEAHQTSSILNFPEEFPFTQNTLRQVEEIKSRLILLELVHGCDIQLRLTPDGQAYLIDPEYLTFDPAFFGMGPLKELDKILADLVEIIKRRAH